MRALGPTVDEIDWRRESRIRKTILVLAFALVMALTFHLVAVRAQMGPGMMVQWGGYGWHMGPGMMGWGYGMGGTPFRR